MAAILFLCVFFYTRVSILRPFCSLPPLSLYISEWVDGIYINQHISLLLLLILVGVVNTNMREMPVTPVKQGQLQDAVVHNKRAFLFFIGVAEEL